MARTEKAPAPPADQAPDEHVVIDADEFEEARRDPRLRELAERADALAARIARPSDDS
jgi:hypothetical protein